MFVIHENASKEASNETNETASSVNDRPHDLVNYSDAHLLINALDYLGDVEEALDRQIYPLQQLAPDSGEFAVVITAEEWLKFAAAMTLLERLSRNV